MKKLFLTALLLTVGAFSAQSQTMSKNALGLRFGSGHNDFGAEISYQRKLSKDNRLEVDFGWNDNNHYDWYKLTGMYQWVWKIDGGFNWYLGAGAGLGTYSHNDDFHHDHPYDSDDDGGFATLAGDIGIEYNFDIPLQIALDLRPEMYFGDFHDDNDFDTSFGLAIRYRFN